MRRKLLILFRKTAPEEPDAGALEVRRATTDDADAFARDVGTYPVSAFVARLGAQLRCYLAVDNGHVVHSSWCSFAATWTEELQTYLAPPSGNAYVFESLTLEGTHGRGIYPIVLRAISADLHHEGVAGIWIGVESTNEAWIRAITKAGFEHSYSYIADGAGSWTVVGPDRHIAADDSLHIVAEPTRDGPSGG